MPSGSRRPSGADGIADSALAAIAEAVESGAGLPEVARALARALDASLAVTDTRGAIVAAAARSPADERSLLGGKSGVQALELRIAENTVGALRVRPQRDLDGPVGRLLLALIAGEVQRLHVPERAAESAAAALLGGLLGPGARDPERVERAARELGLDVAAGASVLLARAHPQATVEEGWRERVRLLATRGARAVSGRAAAAVCERADAAGAEVVVLVPEAGDTAAARAAAAVLRELHSGLPGCVFALGRSGAVDALAELPRAAAEALLAANVAEGSPDEERVLAFEDTGAYRLLLPAMRESPEELRRFYAETVEPLAAYDEQYETELVRTLATFFEADGNVAGTAQRLFAHRHTIYYRLERVRELSGLDVGSSEGREKLSLGLKAMRVLGISAARGPATG